MLTGELKRIPNFMKKKIIFTVLIIIISNLTIHSQELNQLRVIGKAELLPNEIISKDKIDINGDVCAGIMIYTDLDGLSFNSYNGIVDTKIEPGKVLLFLSPGERFLSVMKISYRPIDIILNETGINLRSGQVWKLEITGDKERIPVTIRIAPIDAQLSIDGNLLQPSNSYLLTVSKHLVKIEHKNYKAIDDTIDVSPTNIFFEYILELLKPVPIAINTVPQGGKVYLNNIFKGESNLSFFEFPGQSNLRIINEGYEDINETIELKDTDDILLNTFSYKLVKNSSTIIVKVTPEDAELFIQKVSYGSRREINLPEGKYLIELKKEGYKEFSDIIDIEKNSEIIKEYGLKEITGSLQITVKPVDAYVELISGEEVISSWRGMKRIEQLKIGRYTIKVRAGGYSEKIKEIVIDENYETIENIELEELNSNISIEKILSENELIVSPKLINDNNRIIVTYNLLGEVEEDYKVELFLVSEINKDFERLLTKVTGDVGEGKFTGRDKRIIWEFPKELSGITLEEYYLKIKAEKISVGIPWYYYVLGGAVGGAAAILLGGGSGGSGGGSTASGIADPPGRPTQ